MRPKRIYIGEKVAETLGSSSGAITAMINTRVSKYYKKVCYVDIEGVWHGVEEKPCTDKYFIAKNSEGRIIALTIHEKTNWEKFYQWYKIETWAYVEDLLP